MAMIEVQHLRKNFVKTVKEPGLKGALRSKWSWEVNHHQNADRNFEAHIWLLSD